MLRFHSDESDDPVPPDPLLELGIGVFYFPSTSLSPIDQLAVIERTTNRITTLIDFIKDGEFVGSDCFRVCDIMTWLTRFKNLLLKESEKLREGLNDHSGSNDPTTTTNGYQD